MKGNLFENHYRSCGTTDAPFRAMPKTFVSCLLCTCTRLGLRNRGVFTQKEHSDMSAFGPKRTSFAAPRMSASGVKRTCRFAPHMSAFDPKRTCGNVQHDRSFRRHRLPEPIGSVEGLDRIKRTDGDVISVRISQRKLRSSSAGVHMWLFFQPADERARPWQSYVKVVDPDEQEEAIARLGVVRTCQRGMLVGTPLVETEQDRSIRVDDLPEIVVGRGCLWEAK